MKKGTLIIMIVMINADEKFMSCSSGNSSGLCAYSFFIRKKEHEEHKGNTKNTKRYKYN